LNHIDYLKDIALILAVAVVVAALFRKIKIPSIAGFIFAGIIIGPHALSLVNDPGKVSVLAEMGVVLLLYGIGLEISLSRLRLIWRQVLPAGLMQIALTIMVSFFAARVLGLTPGAALFSGFLVAVSSTAIVLKGLESRGEIDSPHGRLTLGILLLQDFSVVPMILIIPALGSAQSSMGEIIFGVLRACLILLLILAAASVLVPRMLKIVAETRQRHLFVLSVLLITIGTAWLVSLAGISLAIGAFLAGIVVARGEYKHQAISDIFPFKEAFASLFFVSVGMLLDLHEVFGGLFAVLSLSVVIIIAKFLVILFIALVLRLPMRIGLLTGLALAQMGEFSFVMLSEGNENGLLEGAVASKLMASAVITMLATPFLLSWGPPLAAGAVRIRALARPFKILKNEESPGPAERFRDHVIIAGYGFAGKAIASALKQNQIPYLVTDLNPGNIRQAASDGHDAFYGDIASPHVQESLNVESAKELVFLINDPTAVERAISHARRLAPDLHIIVRTRYLLDFDPLKSVGADEIVTAEREAAVKTSEIVLRRHSISESAIRQISRHISDAEE